MINGTEAIYVPPCYLKVLGGLVLTWLLLTGQGNSQEEDLPQYVERLVTTLQSDDVLQRAWAIRQLVSLGESTIPRLMQRFSDRNFTTRRETVSVLGGIGTPKAQEYLLQCLGDKDEGVRNRASLMLLHLSERNPDLWEKIKKVQYPNGEAQQNIAILRETLLQRKIEEELATFISPQGGWGFFEGQYQPLLQLGKGVVFPLLEMFCKDNYAFVTIAYARDRDTAMKIRILAGQALGECKVYLTGREDRKTLNIVCEQVRPLLHHSNPEVQEISCYTLYKLGEEQHLNTKIRSLEFKINDYGGKIEEYRRRGIDLAGIQEEAASSCSELAMVYLRIRKDKEAIGLLTRAVNYAPFFDNAYYNLACAYACLGDIGKGLDSLEKAVELGYDDLGWIQRDGDLKNLRNTPRYQRLIQKLADRFLKK